jgi:hypothetical protein
MTEVITAESAAAVPARAEEVARHAVSEAVWAPSVHNTQPWRFTADAQPISLYADAGRALPVADPDGREMMISCGAALFNVRLALRSLGYVPQTAVRPDPAEPDLVARVAERRCASRLDGGRVRELAAAPPPASARRDGVTAASYPVRAEHTDPYFPGRDFAHGHGWGLPPLSSAMAPRAAGRAALLTTDSDRPVDWVNAGQALQRILLTASTCGVAVALPSHPAEVPWLREVHPGAVRGRLLPAPGAPDGTGRPGGS